MPERRRARLAAALAALVPLVAALAYAVARAPESERAAWYVGLHGALTVLMLGAWGLGHTLAARDAVATRRWTLVAGIAARIVLIGVAPLTTVDPERYVWDGAVALAGHDPYRLAPDAPALAPLRSAWGLPVPHGALATLYPPAALALFALAAAAGPARALLVWKVVVAAASIATLLVTDRVLRGAGRSRHLPLVALSPLLVLEGGVGAHLDLLTALAVALALLALARRRPAAAGAALGAGALVKLLPAVALVPLVAATWGRAGAVVRLAAGATLVLATGYGAALLVGLVPVGRLGHFFAHSRVGSPLFAALAALLPAPALVPVLCLLALLGLLAVAHAARRGRIAAAVQGALALPLVLSPVVYPWYLAALVPAFAVAPSALVLAWQTALPCTYEVNDRVAASGVWAPAAWPLWVIAAACGLGLAVDRARARLRTAGPP